MLIRDEACEREGERKIKQRQELNSSASPRKPPSTPRKFPECALLDVVIHAGVGTPPTSRPHPSHIPPTSLPHSYFIHYQISAMAPAEPSWNAGMVNFMCQLGWTIPPKCLKHHPGCFWEGALAMRLTFKSVDFE